MTNTELDEKTVFITTDAGLNIPINDELYALLKKKALIKRVSVDDYVNELISARLPRDQASIARTC
jgi:hypothetical protein